MKKVCVLTTVHHAYDGRIYHKQCKTLRNAGYEVTLIAPMPENIKKNDDIKLIPISKPKIEWKRFLRTFSIIRLAIQTKADIYHFHDPELLPISVFLRILTGKPVIFDVHEHYPNAIMSKKYLKNWMKKPIRYIYEIIERICLMFLSGVIYTTDEIGTRYKKYRSCKIENYPLPNMFRNIDLTKKNPNLILYLGGITPIRGVSELIDGFNLVAKKHNEAKLLFVGAFEDKSFEMEIKEKIKKLQLENRVEFKGKVPYEKIRNYLEKASIGIIPYLPVPNHLVCLPNKLFEYLAAGVVPVASHFAHYHKVIDESKSGLTINPTDPNSIKKAILELLENNEKTQKMAKNGYIAFNKFFNWEKEGEKLLSFYKKLLL
jgi:glycosyltransferase involved in cell wall biosynthesis